MPTRLAKYEQTFFAARTANGGDAIDWPGGEGLFSVYGTWDGASVQVSYSPDGGTTYIDTDGATFSANATLLLKYSADKVKATVASAGAGTTLTAKFKRA